MRVFIAVLLSLMILYTGCSSTHHLINCYDSKNEFEGEYALLRLKSGEEIEGEIIEIGVDSTFNEKQISSSRLTIPTSEVNEIQIQNHGKGALYGFLYGFGIGLGFGIVHYLSVSDAKRGSSEAYSLLLIPIYTVGAGLGGLIGGAIQGFTNKYVFSSSVPNKNLLINRELGRDYLLKIGTK